MSTSTKALTAEAFWRLPETAMQRNLIRGEVIEKTPPGARHGVIWSEPLIANHGQSQLPVVVATCASNSTGGW